MMPSGPQSITIGTGEFRTSAAAVLRLWGQSAIGPSAVRAQSFSSMRGPISPAPANDSNNGSRIGVSEASGPEYAICLTMSTPHLAEHAANPYRIEFVLQPPDRLWSRTPGERRHDECGTRRRGFVRASPLRQRTKSASSSRVWRRFQKSAIAEIFMHSAFHARCDFRPVHLTTALAGTAPLIYKIALGRALSPSVAPASNGRWAQWACLLATILNSGLRAASAKRSAEI